MEQRYPSTGGPIRFHNTVRGQKSVTSYTFFVMMCEPLEKGGSSMFFCTLYGQFHFMATRMASSHHHFNILECMKVCYTAAYQDVCMLCC